MSPFCKLTFSEQNMNQPEGGREEGREGRRKGRKEGREKETKFCL